MRFETGSKVLTTCFLVFATSDAIPYTARYMQARVAVPNTQKLCVVTEALNIQHDRAIECPIWNR